MNPHLVLTSNPFSVLLKLIVRGGGSLSSLERCPMPNAHLSPTARLIYRGYALEVRPATVGWRVAVYPKRADLPILRYNEIFSREQHRLWQMQGIALTVR